MNAFRYFLVIIIFISFLSVNAYATIGWQFEPAIKITRIDSLTGTLVIITSDGIIKFFDYDTHKLKKTLRFPETTYSRGHYKPSISNIIHEQENLIIQTNQYFSEAKIFLLKKDGNINKIINLPKESRLIASDNTFFYFVQYKTNVDNKNIITLFKFDKSFKQRKNGHFDLYPTLAVIDVFEDNNYYWYVCNNFENIEPDGQAFGNYVFRGDLTILRREKLSDKINTFNIQNDGLIILPIISDNDYIWIFTVDPGRKNKLIRFDKRNGDSFFKYFSERFYLHFPNGEYNKYSENLGAIDIDFGLNKNILYLINKKTLNITQHNIDVPSDLTKLHMQSGSFGHLAIYSENKYFWVGLQKHKDLLPYLLRISKDNMSYEVLQVTPTVEESISMFTTGLFNVLTSPLRIILRP